MSTILCPPCVSREPIEKQVERIKSLKYTIRKTNMKEVIDDHYYQKVNRPNFFFEMGNNKAETATDRFDNEEYKKAVDAILNAELDLPPENIDETEISSN